MFGYQSPSLGVTKWYTDTQIAPLATEAESAFYDDVVTNLEFNELTSTVIYHSLTTTLRVDRTYRLYLTLQGYSDLDISRIASISTFSAATLKGLVDALKTSFGTLVADTPMAIEFSPSANSTHIKIGYNVAYSSDSNKSIWRIVDITENKIDVVTSDTAIITNTVGDNTVVDFSKYSKYEWTINSSGEWSDGNASYSNSYIIPLNDIESISVTANNDNVCYYTLLNSVCPTDGQEADKSGGRARSTVSAGQTVTIDNTIEQAKFLYVAAIGSGYVVYTPRKVVLTKHTKNIYDYIKILEDKITRFEQLISNNISVNADGEDISQNAGVTNAYDRIKRFTEIPWTSSATIPLNSSYGSDLLAGEQTGIIYSSVKELNKFVGWNVSMKTFMTAVHNPYSLLYTENVNSATSASSYGFTYYGSNCAAYYGIVCSSFIMYGLGWDVYWSSREFKYLKNIGYVTKVTDQSATGVRLMDLISSLGHIAIITGIVRDEFGVPTTIYLAETWHPHPVIKDYTVETFNARLDADQETIYRFPDLYKTPAIDDDFDPDTYVYNDDICTFAGDYAAFREGETVYINYTKGSYTDMEIYKDEELVQSIVLDADSGIHSVNVSSYVSTYGDYKACLTDGTNDSDYTYFQVIQTTVACTNDDNVLTVTFSSANGTPEFIQLTYLDGTSRGVYELSDDEVAAGSATFDAVELLRQQYELEFRDHTESGNRFDETTYVKVFFGCDYGVVRNALVDAEIV